MDQLQEYQATPELKVFFERLLKLKSFVKTEATNSKDEVLKKIHDELESLIKDTK
jgi:hypothetical protein